VGGVVGGVVGKVVGSSVGKSEGKSVGACGRPSIQRQSIHATHELRISQR
jgi:uncharacterized protein YcfJ